ncbi:MAG: hypothetical protein WC325_07060 [Candidatus Bathyarchaeia archaeon]
MNKAVALFLIMLLAVLSIVAVGVQNGWLKTPQKEPFYVGVTYCGNSTQEAITLIDKVKDYSNLFVLQSGVIQGNPEQITEICDYAVSSDMYFMVYFGLAHSIFMQQWLNNTTGRWGDHFLGVYYCDENGGKMLDYDRPFFDEATLSSLVKQMDGSVTGFRVDNYTTATYWPDGRIKLTISEPPTSPFEPRNETVVEYYTNGTIIATNILEEYNPRATIYDSNQSAGLIFEQVPPPKITILENYNTTYTYDELWNMRPFQTYDETAERFTNRYYNSLIQFTNAGKNITAITSDYVLYWFDYKSGYNVILAQLGWNHTLAQDIALVRGAATLQNKPWGAIITWKYNNPPYLDSGEAIYNQMRMAYEAGATYVVIFNYAEDMTGPYGTLQEEHFSALERFWNQVVQSPFTEKGSTKAEAVLVLPKNYGWGMRTPEDRIWGIWSADDKSQQIWQISRSLLEKYDLHLDVVYEDPEFTVNDYYSKVYYWNQTGYVE